MLTVPDLFEDLGHALATDYFFLREQLTDAQLDVLRRVRVFVDDEVLPVIGGYWERAEMPWPLIRRSASWGSSARTFTATVARPRSDRVGPGPHGAEPRRRQPRHVPRRAGRAGHAVDRHARVGGAEAALAAGMARLETLGAFALTEPDHGSDSVSLATSARRDGGDG